MYEEPDDSRGAERRAAQNQAGLPVPETDGDRLRRSGSDRDGLSADWVTLPWWQAARRVESQSKGSANGKSGLRRMRCLSLTATSFLTSPSDGQSESKTMPVNVATASVATKAGGLEPLPLPICPSPPQAGAGMSDGRET